VLDYEYRAPAPELPSAREWFRHTILFLLTFVTSTYAGMRLVWPDSLDGQTEPASLWPGAHSLIDYLLAIPLYLLHEFISLTSYSLGHPSLIGQGLLFSGSLMTILAAHEAGHYIACRRYGVAATLPYFIPAPPFFLAGTLGAFIRIKSPFPDRRAIFDIGLAGPLAGFVVILPCAILGLMMAKPVPPELLQAPGVITLNDPPLITLFARLMHVNLSVMEINPLYFASWVGLLVTGLNLLPVGQLDGGHATYALFGVRPHKLIGVAGFLIMLMLSISGWVLHGVPSGLIYTLLLLVLLRARHPHALDEDDQLGIGRILVAVVTVLVFALCFTPFPITLQ
ncbi:MAG: site-2 protease family protein, partial [Pyrinomonadaceae bacterium]